MIRPRCLKVLLFIVLLILSCGLESDFSRQKGTEEGDIFIGVAWPRMGRFIDGVTMAISEINKKGDLLGGRKIRTIIEYNEKSSLEKDQKIAKKFAKNNNIVAVIGHPGSIAANSVSVTYEYNKTLFIAVKATDPRLTNRGFRFVFRTIPSEEEIVKRLAKFASENKIKNAAVLFEKSNYGGRLADFFQTASDKYGIKIVVRQPYFSNRPQVDLRPLLGQIRKDFEFDAVFLAQQDYLNFAEIIKQSCEMGIIKPFLIADILDGSEILQYFPNEAEGIIVTTFNPYLPLKSTQEFVKKFFSAFQTLPDLDAAQGYDAIKLLAAAFEKSKSTDPRIVASHLHYALTKWQGVCGPYAFDPQGNVLEKDMFFMLLRNGKFIYFDKSVKE